MFSKKQAIRMAAEEIAADLRNVVFDINNGGCGVFAQLFCEQLKKRGIKFRIAAFGGQYTKDKNMRKKKAYVREILKDNNFINAGETSAGHFMVIVGDLIIDGTTTETTKAFYDWHSRPIGYYTLEEMTTAVRYGDWSSSYNREHNATVKELIIYKMKAFYDKPMKTGRMAEPRPLPVQTYDDGTPIIFPGKN